MPLTKKELAQIKGVVHDEVNRSVETLATVINKAFGTVHKQIELLDKRVELIEREIQHVNARLNAIEHDVAEIRKHFVYRDEFEDVLTRLKAVEKKVGLKN